MQGVAGPWTCGAGCVLNIVGAAVEPQPPVGVAVVAPYQAQARRPSGPARVHPQGNGIVQAVVGTWGQAVGLPLALLGAVAIAL